MSIRRPVVRSLVLAAVALLTLYIGDNLVLRYRVWKGLQPYGSVTVKRYFAIKRKDQRVEFAPADPVARTCVHSVLPQMGAKPCWYVEQKTSEQIDM